METNYKTLLPANTRLRKHMEKELFFAYPEGGKFVEFSRSDGATSTRLLYETDGQVVRIELDLLPGGQKAQERAEKLFNASDEHPVNIAATHMKINNLEVWRLRRLFIEGVSTVWVNDAAFIQVQDHVYRLQYYAHPDVFEQGRWVFETVLQTLHLVEGAG